MRFKSFHLISLLLTLFVLTVLPVSAQTEEPTDVPADSTEQTCTVDLSNVLTILDEAQAASDEGSLDEAVTLLEAAEDELHSIRLGCQTIPELIETSVSGVLTFGVPEDWTTRAVDEDASDGSLTFIMATDAGALEASTNSTPDLVDDQQVIGVVYAAGDEIGSIMGGDSEMTEITLEAVVQNLIATLDDENDALLTQPEALTVKDWRAQNFRLSLDGSEATAYVVEVDRGAAYVVMIGLGANGSLDAVDVVTRAVVDTLDYTVLVGSAAPGSAAPTPTAP